MREIAPEIGTLLADGLRNLTPGEEPRHLGIVDWPTPSGPQRFEAVAHRSQNSVILEFESLVPARISFQTLYPVVRSFIDRMKSLQTVEALSALAAEEVRKITGFDRVMVYRFDPEWNGNVIAESLEPGASSFLNLRFPASDIPVQARALYVLNRFRMIGDVSYQPIPVQPTLHPDTQQPLDLSYSALRSVSPIHLEYLKNMEVGASMSISIITQQSALWGLIACHHRTPRRVSVETRIACDLLAQSLSVQVQAAELHHELQQRLRYNALAAELLSFMSQEEQFIHGLTHHPAELLEFAEASGAAVIYQGRCELFGATPTSDQVDDLLEWLTKEGRPEVLHTNHLASLYPPAAAYAHRASGLLAIGISKLYPSYVLWFRPEVVQTVNWSGDPTKAVQPAPDGGVRLHPRQSFAIWKQTVRDQSLPWEPTRVEAASSLRNAIVGIVLRKAEELADITAELQRSNRELEAFSYSVSHDLRAPFRHITGYAELLRRSAYDRLDERERRFIDSIMQSARFAGTLVDNLLGLSRVGRAQLHPRPVDLDKLVRETIRSLEFAETRRISWKLAPLGTIVADAVLLRLVWQNLLDNAIKFTARREVAEIEVGMRSETLRNVYWVRDNGVGFEQAYVDKLFGVFQRLHRMEDFEGTGIGLANVRRIVARHGGETWAEGKLDEGATFFFTLPRS